jgi:hypothetical protein
MSAHILRGWREGPSLTRSLVAGLSDVSTNIFLPTMQGMETQLFPGSGEEHMHRIARKMRKCHTYQFTCLALERTDGFREIF